MSIQSPTAALPAFAFTKTPNTLFDEYLPHLSGNEAKLLCALIRHTLGFHRLTADLSFNQLKSATGIKSKATLDQAIQALERLGLFHVLRNAGRQRCNRYVLNDEALASAPPANGSKPEPSVRDGSESGLSPTRHSSISEPGQSKKRTMDGSKTEPSMVQKSNHPERKQKDNPAKENQKESFLPAGQLPDDSLKAQRLLVEFGIWPTVARRLVLEHSLSLEYVARAIGTLQAEVASGMRVRNPAALLRSRLASDWQPPNNQHANPDRPEESHQQETSPVQEHAKALTVADGFGSRIDVHALFNVLYGQLQQTMPRETFDTWLRRAELAHFRPAQDNQPAELTIRLPDEFAYEWVRHRLDGTIRKMLKFLTSDNLVVRYTAPHLEDTSNHRTLNNRQVRPYTNVYTICLQTYTPCC
jgi:hypothetical protein